MPSGFARRLAAVLLWCLCLGAPAHADILMVAHIAFRGATSTTITAPAGWALLRRDNIGTDADAMNTAIYYRLATPADNTAASYTWTLSSASRLVSGIVAYDGVDPANPIAASAAQLAAASALVTAPSVTSAAGDWVYRAFTLAVGASVTATSGGALSERYAARTGAGPNGVGAWVGDHTQAASGDTGERIATFDRAGGNIGQTLAIRPASGSSVSLIGTEYFFTGGGTAASIPVPKPPGVAVGLLVHHYAISFPAGDTGVTCEPLRVRFTAHDAMHQAVAQQAGITFSITATPARGTWLAPLASGSGAWAPSGANNGAATYTWPGGETYFEALLDQGSPLKSINFNVIDSTLRTEDGSEDPSASVANATIRITSDGVTASGIGTQIAGKRSDEGYGAKALYVQAIRAKGGNCAALFQGEAVSVDFGAECVNPALCAADAGTELQLLGSGGFVNIAKVNAGVAPVYTAVPLVFSNDAYAVAPIVVRHGDAGQLRLHMRAPAGTQKTTGASDAFVVRPFGLRVSGPTTSAAPSPTDPVFAIAGDDFAVTLTAVAWNAGDDLDSDGVADTDAQLLGNGITPSFGRETPPAIAYLSHTLHAPAGGNPGTLGGSTTYTGWIAGSRTQQVNWSEVGFLNLLASTPNYLGGGQEVRNSATGYSGVGRFRPQHFAVVGTPALVNRAGAACTPASAFTYLGEDFRLDFTLQARNSAAVVTQNYSTAGGYALLSASVPAQLDPAALLGTTNLGSRLVAVSSTGPFVAGAADIRATLRLARPMPDDPEPPLTPVRVGIAPADSDSVRLLPAALDMDVDGAGGNDHRQIGADTAFRYGRLRMLNAVGSERLALPLGIRTEYWTGSAFALNTLDDCTTLDRANVAMSFTPISNLEACETIVNAGAPETGTIAFSGGVGALTLSAPGAGNDGSVLLTVQLGTTASGSACNASAATVPAEAAIRRYLLGRWNDADNPDGDANTRYDDNPAARAAFGLYGAQPRNFIYFRENY
ncbi:MAG: DUF6701 domain-containing protein [Burkholderiales bacterium]